MPREQVSSHEPIAQIIRRRYSCRTYSRRPIEPATRQRLQEFIAASDGEPFGSDARFQLLAATEQDQKALSGLGTYGFIRSPAGFVTGAVRPADRNMEDVGYLMERIVLFATAIGLGTCWLGGTFHKSNFARRIGLEPGETLPAVVSVGYAAEKPRRVDRLIRRGAGSDARKSWDQLFFDGTLDQPLPPEAAGAFAEPLELVRLAPSASNKQPWRLLRRDGTWHFWLQRTPGYGGSNVGDAAGVSDMQRIDMGIAMCHFELGALELGLEGSWGNWDPGMPAPGSGLEYVASWHPARQPHERDLGRR